MRKKGGEEGEGRERAGADKGEIPREAVCAKKSGAVYGPVYTSLHTGRLQLHLPNFHTHSQKYYPKIQISIKSSQNRMQFKL